LLGGFDGDSLAEGFGQHVAELVCLLWSFLSHGVILGKATNLCLTDESIIFTGEGVKSSMTKILQPWEILGANGDMAKAKPKRHHVFREKLIALRNASGMNGKQLAAALKKAGIEKGASESTIYRWESDGDLPGLDILIELATIYKVPIEFLVNNEMKTPLVSSGRGEIENAILVMADEMTYEKAVKWLAKGLKGLKGQPGTAKETDLDDLGR
jgi:transcriptional regulator with XRE-family HTH domain